MVNTDNLFNSVKTHTHTCFYYFVGTNDRQTEPPPPTYTEIHTHIPARLNQWEAIIAPTNESLCFASAVQKQNWAAGCKQEDGTGLLHEHYYFKSFLDGRVDRTKVICKHVSPHEPSGFSVKDNLLSDNQSFACFWCALNTVMYLWQNCVMTHILGPTPHRLCSRSDVSWCGRLPLFFLSSVLVYCLPPSKSSPLRA